MGFLTGYILGGAVKGRESISCVCPETIIKKVNVCSNQEFSGIFAHLTGLFFVTILFTVCCTLLVFAIDTSEQRSSKIFCKIALGLVFAIYISAGMMIVCNYLDL